MKKLFKKIASLVLCAIMGVSVFAGCGSTDEVLFWVTGTAEQLKMYSALTEAFNSTYGAEHDIKVKAVQRLVSGYESVIETTAGSRSGPDIYLVRDDVNVKKWIIAQYFGSIQKEWDAITDMDMGNVSSNAYENLRYDRATNTSNEDDPLYGIPLDKQTTALYYNVDIFENAGVLVISVDEEDLESWSKGEIADNNGLMITDAKCASLKALLESENKIMPAKGYFRSEKPYVQGVSRRWYQPDESEVLVFNNRISMSWDETEDLAMLFTKASSTTGNIKNYNPNSSSTFGYFTEWWFEYGWSVGGDCLTDLTGNGDWNFSLLDPNPNYIVTGDEFVGRTGKKYVKGETIEFLDKMNIEGNEKLVPVENCDGANVPSNYGDYYKADGVTIAGVWQGITNELAKGENSAIGELPSTRTAFERYLKLGTTTSTEIGDSYGLSISPTPNAVSQRGLISYFISGEVAFVSSKSNMLVEFTAQQDTAKVRFDVAPLLKYKEYTDPTDPFCDEVKVEGKNAGHCNCVSAVVRMESAKKDKATAFLKWCMSTEGQKIRANNGFFPLDEALVGEIKLESSIKATNTSVLVEALKYQKPGDWWYMPDEAWVQKWCTDLNASLRAGVMTYNEWLSGTGSKASVGGAVIKRTNEYLKEYERLFNK